MTNSRGSALWAATVAAVIVSMASIASAQVYYQYPGATVVSDDEPTLGAVFGLGDDLVRILGYGRFNVTDESDFGLEVLLDHFDAGVSDDGWRFGAAADYKYAIVPAETRMPFDLSVDAGFGFQTGADVTNINIPVGGIISRPLELQNSRILVPYAALYLVVTHVSIDLPPGARGDADDTDLDVQLRLGASIEVVGGTSAFATVQIGDDDMFFIGVNAPL